MSCELSAARKFERDAPLPIMFCSKLGIICGALEGDKKVIQTSSKAIGGQHIHPNDIERAGRIAYSHPIGAVVGKCVAEHRIGGTASIKLTSIEIVQITA